MFLKKNKLHKRSYKSNNWFICIKVCIYITIFFLYKILNRKTIHHLLISLATTSVSLQNINYINVTIYQTIGLCVFKLFFVYKMLTTKTISNIYIRPKHYFIFHLIAVT